MNAQDVNILIVEDETLLAQDVRLKLGHLGYNQVKIVNSGVQAVNHVLRNNTDLVLIDSELLHGIDCIQTTNEIHQISNIPIIYLSPYSDQNYLNQAHITDAMGYILKPVSERELQAAITIALGKAGYERLKRELCLRNAILFSLFDGLLVWSKEGKVIQVNKAMLSLLNAKEHELLGNEINEVICLCDYRTGVAVTDKIVSVIQAQGQLKEFRELVLFRANKPNIPALICGNKVIDTQDYCYGYSMLIQDISEQKTGAG